MRQWAALHHNTTAAVPQSAKVGSRKGPCFPSAHALRLLQLFHTGGDNTGQIRRHVARASAAEAAVAAAATTVAAPPLVVDQQQQQ